MRDMSGSLPKALLILEFMTERQKNVSFKDLKGHTGFAANVLSRLLKTYIGWGYIQKDPGSGLYSLGTNMYALCEKVLGRRPRKDAIVPVLNGLSAGLQESAAYFDFDGEWMTLLAKSEVANSYHYLDIMSRDIHSPVNGFFFCGLPFLSESQCRDILQKRGDNYGYTEEVLLRTFAEIRENRCYISKEVYRRSQITRICSPVFEESGQKFAGVLGVTIISHSFEADDLAVVINTVRDAASAASAMF
jgi:DNA-binding IclR family transcriptional regulator